jgi:hypothetical protein
MKKLTTILLFLTCSLASAGGNFYSYIIHPTDQPLHITVQNHRYVKILTFVQDGSDNCIGTVCTGGMVSVTQNNLAPAVVQYRNQTTEQSVTIAGPAVLSVNPVPGANLFLTIFQESNPN